MRILLADDHHLVREAIASYLTRAAKGISCAEASDFQQVRERLAGAARLMAAGESYVPASAINDLPRRYWLRAAAARVSFDNLTPRELDCIELLVRGATNRELAGRLVIAK